ncbi:tyrosine--tRNA ligase [Candidatus Vidania fulgoroideorum]
MIIKFGIDPNGKLHLGHLYIIKKIEKYMNKNDILIFLIGNFTCTIGDPSMRLNIRKRNFNILKNIKSIIKYTKSIFKKKIIFLKNSYWYTNMNFLEIIKIFDISIRTLINRREIKRRIKNKNKVNTNEVLYPLFQGYDNVIINPDIEFGGKDQKINFKISREIQKRFNKKNTKFIELNLIESISKKKKMSKSCKEECIFLHENARNIFQKILKISNLKMKYFIKKFSFLMKKHLILKYKINSFLKEKFYFFYLIFNFKKISNNFFEYYKKYKIIYSKNDKIINILIKNEIFLYKNEIKRLLKQNSISLNNRILKDKNVLIKKNDKLRIGKKKFFIFK